MFSWIIRSIADYVFGNEDVLNDDVLSVQVTRNSEKDLDREDEDVVEKNGNSFENRNFNGVVSSYFNNRGLINDEIYFTQSVVIGNDQPRVGDNVFVKATRSHSEAGWVASSVQIVSLWTLEKEEENGKPFKDFVMGTVVDVSGKCVKIRTNTEMNVSIQKFIIGYKPFRGDWINIEIWNKNDGSRENNETIDEKSIISISPMREKKIHGTVSEIVNRFGFINDDIYFSFSVCQKGFYVRKGDSVIAVVIESRQTRGDWRATHVEKKRESNSKENKNNPYTDSLDQSSKSINSAILIDTEVNFGDIKRNEKRKAEIKVRNTGSRMETFLLVEPSISVPGFVCKCGPDDEKIVKDLKQCGDKQLTVGGKILCPSMKIPPNETKLLPVEFIPENIGKVNFQLVFTFDGCIVTSTVKANVMDQLQIDLTANNLGTYKKPQMFLGRVINNASGNILPGQRPVRKRKIFLPNKLAKYPIPSYLREYLLHADDGNIESVVPELNQPLHISNYRKKLSTLLYTEEIQMEKEMRQFDMFNVILRRFSDYLSLQVPGLAEGRPSLLLGDSVVVSYSEKERSSRYEGFIHEVKAEGILLKFCEDFHRKYQHEDVDVQFHFNRTPLRRAHQAIEHAIKMGEETLFPTIVNEKEPLVKLNKNGVKFFNSSLNERQRQAVQRILSGIGRPVPYILFGPPGTGKSVTLVESILQVFKHIRHSRILACAPSNSAADLITEKLHVSGVIGKRDMVRLNAFQRSKQGMAECIEPYCASDVDDLNFVSRYRIIITTCNMAGFLYSFNLKVGHFTHVFVDEAGQATEPECMIPIGFTAGSEDSHVVLAGDPHQLGPVLRSDIAQDYGLNISFLERLSSTELYERNEVDYKQYGSYNPLVVTKLVNNYRSHSSLLYISSSIFYDRELVPCADKTLVDTFVNSDILPNDQCPFVFHGVRGEDFREGNSPSWFNPAEAVETIKYVQKILRKFPDMDMEQIGIITPYRKQVEKIRVLLDRFDLSDIKVGSVEEFQGQERQCIVVSTVRSNEELINFDCHHNIGFLSNPKRFNVSITRAQALMVIVGNPVVLCSDPYWCSLLQYAVMNNAYVGCDLPSLDSPLVIKSVQRAFALLGLHQLQSTKCENQRNSSLDSPPSIEESKQVVEENEEILSETVGKIEEFKTELPVQSKNFHKNDVNSESVQETRDYSFGRNEKNEMKKKNVSENVHNIQEDKIESFKPSEKVRKNYEIVSENVHNIQEDKIESFKPSEKVRKNYEIVSENAGNNIEEESTKEVYGTSKTDSLELTTTIKNKRYYSKEKECETLINDSENAQMDLQKTTESQSPAQPKNAHERIEQTKSTEEKLLENLSTMQSQTRSIANDIYSQNSQQATTIVTSQNTHNQQLTTKSMEELRLLENAITIQSQTSKILNNNPQIVRQLPTNRDELQQPHTSSPNSHNNSLYQQTHQKSSPGKHSKTKTGGRSNALLQSLMKKNENFI